MHDIFVVTYTKNYQQILEQYPHARLVAPQSRLEILQRVAAQAVTKHAWIIDDRYDYAAFDFNYTPPWHQDRQIHVWQQGALRSGDTCLVNVRELTRQLPELDQPQNYQHCCWHTESVPLRIVPEIVIWNYGGHDENLQQLTQRFPTATVLRYIGTHLDMMKKSAARVAGPDFWVLASCCDYTDFDPTWKPSWETEHGLHCWASGSQKFGDTFYVPTQRFAAQADSIAKLEYYNNVYWYSNGYPRLPWPINQLTAGDIFSALRRHRFASIYEYFVAPGSTLGSTVDPSLWENRNLIAYNRNGHVSLCPRDCISKISTKIKDYPYIQYHSCEKSNQKPQDIVFISYDEKDADLNYDLLLKRHPNARRVHRVQGMVNALKIAASKSNTPWYYAVFAKTKIADGFDFNFNPDYLSQPGNYIFQSYNQITDTTYGHGAVLLYHCSTILNATQWGYDFTTSFPYQSIPLLSCYNDAKTPWEAWRTSFREVLKLKSMNTIESKYRMHRWLTVGNGDYGKWSILGARDAVNYNDSIEYANDWNWLKTYFIKVYAQNQLHELF